MTEDTCHFLCCNSNPAISHGLDEFRKDPKFPDEHPIRQIIVQGIRQWINHPGAIYQPDTTGYSESFTASVQTAVKSQTANRLGQRHTQLSEQVMDGPCISLSLRTRCPRYKCRKGKNEIAHILPSSICKSHLVGTKRIPAYPKQRPDHGYTNRRRSRNQALLQQQNGALF